MPTGIGTGLLLSSIIGTGGSLIGGALSKNSKSSSSTTPTMDPKYAGLQDLVLKAVQQRLASGPQDMSAYTAQGIKDTNRTYDLVGQSQRNNLTARGLATSPIAGMVDANRDVARAGDIGSFERSIPLLQRELQTRDLNMAGNVLSLGRGTSSTSTGTSGGGAGGAFENLAGYLGYLQGKGVFGRGGQSGMPGQMGMPGALGTAGAY